MATATLDDVRDSLARTGRRVLEARFYLTEVTRRQAWAPSPGDSKISCGVTFNAAKAGLFGHATPTGTIQMSVQNPSAAALLDEVHLRAITERGTLPVFRVYLVEELPGEEE